MCLPTLPEPVKEKLYKEYSEQILAIPDKTDEYVELASDAYEPKAGDPLCLRILHNPTRPLKMTSGGNAASPK